MAIIAVIWGNLPLDMKASTVLYSSEYLCRDWEPMPEFLQQPALLSRISGSGLYGGDWEIGAGVGGSEYQFFSQRTSSGRPR